MLNRNFTTVLAYRTSLRATGFPRKFERGSFFNRKRERERERERERRCDDVKMICADVQMRGLCVDVKM